MKAMRVNYLDRLSKMSPIIKLALFLHRLTNLMELCSTQDLSKNLEKETMHFMFAKLDEVFAKLPFQPKLCLTFNYDTESSLADSGEGLMPILDRAPQRAQFGTCSCTAVTLLVRFLSGHKLSPWASHQIQVSSPYIKIMSLV